MKSSTLRLLALLLVSMSVACGSTAPSGEQPTPASADKPATVETQDYAGTYKNSAGGTLTIENFVANKGFDFKLTITSADKCNSVNYGTTATFTTPTEAKSKSGGLFKLNSGDVNFEPDAGMIGMECARVLDVDFKKSN